MNATAMPEADLEASVCFALYTSMQATLQLYRDLLAPWGLTFQQALVLAVLWEHGDASPGDLATALQLDSSSISGLLNRMEAAGLVQRAPSQADRRAVRVTPTERSLQIRSELAPVGQCIVEALALDRDDAVTLVGSLHALRDRITDYDTAAALAAHR
ncbi:MarR family transcriptional regulator [Microbacterium jejuense]|uniref:MarR family winged helix-turn-helix transcriptional regulator n=1 Tax=Microbacterium jejuense TaxID=1263637 RepID=UPI0031ECCC18